MSVFGKGSNLRRWLPHVLLGLLLGVELIAAAVAHRDEDQLLALASEGEPKQRVWAIHVLANRGDVAQGPIDPAFVRALMADPEPLVADLPYTVDLCRVGRPMRQERRMSSQFEESAVAPPDTLEDWWRRYAFYRRKVGGKNMGAALRLRNQEVLWLYDVFEGRSLDNETMEAYVEARMTEVNAHRLNRLQPSLPGPRSKNQTNPRPRTGDSESNPND